MAYTMAHILAAEKVLGNGISVRDYPTYILGAIAPDAVHADPDFTTGLKERSHLFAFGLRWGEIGDEEEAGRWLGSIKKYYMENRDRYHRDFLLGYVVHLLVDVYHSLHFYAPFIQSIRGGRREAIEQFKRESYAVNAYLLSLYSVEKDLRSVLCAGEAVGLEGVIKKEQIERRIDQLFEVEFQGWDISHIDGHGICRVEDTERLIQGAAEYVKEVLAGWMSE